MGIDSHLDNNGDPASGTWEIGTPEADSGPTDAEKLDYVYRFCQTLEEVFMAVNESPMAKMLPGMPDLSAFNKE